MNPNAPLPEKRVSFSRRLTVIGRIVKDTVFPNNTPLTTEPTTPRGTTEDVPINRNSELLEAFLTQNSEVREAA